LHIDAALFVAKDTGVVKALFPDILNRVYLLALEQSEVSNKLRSLEENVDGSTEQLFARTLPSYWSDLVHKNCSTWKDVESGLDVLLQKPLPKDLDSLRIEESHARSIIFELSSLQSTLSLSENPLREQLLFLTQQAFSPDQLTATFPQCLEKSPELFLRLDKCGEEISLSSCLGKVIKRLEECQNIQRQLNPPKIRTEVDAFFFNYDRSIFEAAIGLIHDCLEVSLQQDPLDWPIDLHYSFDEALKETPPLSQVELLAQISPDKALREQFLYRLASKYINKDPSELMQEKITELNNPALQALSQAMSREAPEKRADTLYKFFLKMGLPWDLVSLRDWAQLYRASEGLMNLGSARESKIDPNEEHHSRIGKGDEKDRFCELVASPNPPNPTERGI
jgi:hypothetical protein